MSYKENYAFWKKHVTKKEQAILAKYSLKEQKDAFSNDMAFGTAGLRGEMNLGSAYMNHYNIQRASLAFAQFLHEKFDEETLLTKGIVIGHDNRHHSKEFCQTATTVLTNANIKVLLFDEPTPTPIVSYVTQAAKAAGGIVITASHNPKQYNGYKIYNEHGAQYLPKDTDIIGKYYKVIQTAMFDHIEAKNDLIEKVADKYRQTYFDDVIAMQFNKAKKKDLKIVYSNFHGTGKNWTPVLLKECGYEVIIVHEQYEYDADFTTVPYPNPEVLSNYDLAIKTAEKHKADLIIVNDPDADRIGIGVYHHGTYRLLNGNETGPILLEYWLHQHQENEVMPANPTMYNTFVTSHLSDRVAQDYNVKCQKTLTGFKWIASMVEQKDHDFMFGFEEAYGYVLNPIVRDKDGIQAALMLAEACLFFKEKQMTFVNLLSYFYFKFGYFFCHTYIEKFNPLNSAEQIKEVLTRLRTSWFKKLGDWKIKKTEDYLNKLYGMPAQNLLKFYFHDGSWLAVRGSGTEPKMKFYYVSVNKTSMQIAEAQLKKAHSELKTILNLHDLA